MGLSLLTTSHSFAQQTDERAGKKTNSAGLPWWQPTAEIPKLSDFPLGPVYRIREAAKKPFSTKLSDAHIPNIVILKFKDGLTVNATAGGFTFSEKTFPDADLRRGMANLSRESKQVEADKISSLLMRAGGAKIISFIKVSQAEHDAEMAKLNLYSHVPLADLSTYFTLQLPEKTTAETAMRLINELNASDAVELAEGFVPPVVASTSAAPRTLSVAQNSPVTTLPHEFSASQQHLQPAPAGINAQYAWNFAGGKGEGTRFVDLEFDWNVNHEDLTQPTVTSIGILQRPGWYIEHGTPVIGILNAQHNSYGVKGIIPAAQWGYGQVSGATPAEYETSVAATITEFAARTNNVFYPSGLRTGDGLLLELQDFHPNCTNALSCPLLPVEVKTIAYNAIQSAVAKGLVVVEAGANGINNAAGVNLNNYLSNYLPYNGGDNFASIAGSGAALVGARNSWANSRSGFSNFGGRIDFFGQGDSVYTTYHSGNVGSSGPYCNVGMPYVVWPPTGFSGLQSSENQCYTSAFSGTSSASPIVLGALMSLQGIHKANYPVSNAQQIPNAIRPRHLLPLLKKDGTPQEPPLLPPNTVRADPIGVGPDMLKAIAFYNTDADGDGHSNGKEAAMGWDRHYRLYNPTSQRHFWTSDENERNILSAPGGGYSCEGLSYKLFGYPEAHNGAIALGSAVPLYRLYNGATQGHLFSSSLTEKDILVSSGWSFEGRIGFVSPNPAPNLVPLIRIHFASRKYHFSTTDANEANYWVNVVGSASYDGILGYVVPISAAANGVSQCAY